MSVFVCEKEALRPRARPWLDVSTCAETPGRALELSLSGSIHVLGDVDGPRVHEEHIAAGRLRVVRATIKYARDGSVVVRKSKRQRRGA